MSLVLSPSLSSILSLSLSLSLSVGDEGDLEAASLCLWLAASAHTRAPLAQMYRPLDRALICGVASEGFQEVVQFRRLADSRGVRMSDDRNNNTQSRNAGFRVEGRRAVGTLSRLIQPASLGLRLWLWHLRAVQLWATCITFLCLGFTVGKMGVCQHPRHGMVRS